MRNVKPVTFALLLGACWLAMVPWAHAASQAQQRAAEEYLHALARGDAHAMALSILEDELAQLRNRLLEEMRLEADRGGSLVRGRLFGEGMPLADIERLTPHSFFVALSQRLRFGGRSFRRVDWLEAVKDRGGMVQMVGRLIPPSELGEVRVQMTMQGGAVRARFESSNVEARELMTAGLGALRGRGLEPQPGARLAHLHHGLAVPDLVDGLLLRALQGAGVAAHRHRVRGRVIHPPAAEHRVLHGPQQRVLGSLERAGPVGHRDVQETLTPAQDHRFDTDLAGRVVETVGAHLREGAGTGPRLTVEPLPDDVELAGNEDRVVDDGHARG